VELRIGEFVFDAETAGDAGAVLVLLLHGFPQTNHSWRAQLPELAKAGYRAFAPNQRGYSAGARPDGAEHYRSELLVADALSFADSLGAERFHLVGHDWGGQIAWLVAARYAERVRSLTVLSRPHPAAFATSMKSDSKQAGRSKHHRAFQRDDAADRLLEGDAEALRAALVGQGVPEPDLHAYLSVLGDRDALEAAIQWYRSALGSDSALLGEAVPDVRVPTLYLWGDEDATVGRVAAEATRAHVSGPYEFRVLVGAGHFLTDQRPDAVTQALLEHLARHPD